MVIMDKAVGGEVMLLHAGKQGNQEMLNNVSCVYVYYAKTVQALIDAKYQCGW